MTKRIVRPGVKRRRSFKNEPVAAAPEPATWEKFYAQPRPCRMVELGFKIKGCKGTFTPRGNEVTCSNKACNKKNRSLLNLKSDRKRRKENPDEWRGRINAWARARRAARKAPGRPCQGPRNPNEVGGPRCAETYYSWIPHHKYCTVRCRQNRALEILKERRRSNKKKCKHPGCCEEFQPNGGWSFCPKHRTAEAKKERHRLAQRAKPRKLWCKYCESYFERRGSGRAPEACPKPKCQEAKLAKRAAGQVVYTRERRRKLRAANPLIRMGTPWLAESVSKTTWYRRKREAERRAAGLPAGD
jgi:hypothetical protein